MSDPPKKARGRENQDRDVKSFFVYWPPHKYWRRSEVSTYRILLSEQVAVSDTEQDTSRHVWFRQPILFILIELSIFIFCNKQWHVLLYWILTYILIGLSVTNCQNFVPSTAILGCDIQLCFAISWYDHWPSPISWCNTNITLLCISVWHMPARTVTDKVDLDGAH